MSNTYFRCCSFNNRRVTSVDRRAVKVQSTCHLHDINILVSGNLNARGRTGQRQVSADAKYVHSDEKRRKTGRTRRGPYYSHSYRWGDDDPPQLCPPQCYWPHRQCTVMRFVVLSLHAG